MVSGILRLGKAHFRIVCISHETFLGSISF